jgi:hypothetical protein
MVTSNPWSSARHWSSVTSPMQGRAPEVVCHPFANLRQSNGHDTWDSHAVILLGHKLPAPTKFGGVFIDTDHANVHRADAIPKGASFVANT